MAQGQQRFMGGVMPQQRQGSNEPDYVSRAQIATVQNSTEFTSADIRNSLDRRTNPALRGAQPGDFSFEQFKYSPAQMQNYPGGSGNGNGSPTVSNNIINLAQQQYIQQQQQFRNHPPQPRSSPLTAALRVQLAAAQSRGSPQGLSHSSSGSPSMPFVNYVANYPPHQGSPHTAQGSPQIGINYAPYMVTNNINQASTPSPGSSTSMSIGSPPSSLMGPPQPNDISGRRIDFREFSNENAETTQMQQNQQQQQQANQYKDLMQLIQYQRDKIHSQQAELNKYDAEIAFLENKSRDQLQALDAIKQEIAKQDQVYREGADQLQSLSHVDEESEIVKQQEKMLKSEITLLRSKLANCETELLQCKNKIRLLMDEIELEQRNQQQFNGRQQMERSMMAEIERIQSEIDSAVQTADNSNQEADNLKKEITVIENAISDKKKQLEQLIQLMKEVNLQSLTGATSEEVKAMIEGK